ncbi:DNA cytosine methyltransferase [Exiguobacterium mexicanum]|jgi:DNA (cytosine-5)-methyltransferase 1|uniref:Cytosine-specific methyltransferase n=1 Tax=Exiguobacterium mexicanum TaxID=340146 RepID=A0ABT7MNN0_9BACL|nr:DNA cytosine methyltransferase [Exiguobacterium mexicanum]MDL5376802.1 DNA cytosine methyltransferase [Exiguobacterium mexicanum]
MKKTLSAISLFSGAGGMDVGFVRAGISVKVANEINKDAAATYQRNHPDSKIYTSDINEVFEEISETKDIDIVFGGPPCQGFSVAGKMDPNDERNTLIWSFLDVVHIVQPRAFVMENVKALGSLEKWKPVRDEIFKRAENMGYSCEMFILNSADFGVPQKRERVFFIGFLNKDTKRETLEADFIKLHKPSRSIRDTIKHLGPAGSESNPQTCTAKITFASNPILRKSPYAGMLFNGMGRPLNIDETSNTLPASMGGNKTPIIDEEYLHGDEKENWVNGYHEAVTNNELDPKFQSAPSRLRRLTIKEAALIQTFPEDYIFEGSKSSVYRQIGNAVPCELAEVVAKVVVKELKSSDCNLKERERQISFATLF